MPSFDDVFKPKPGPRKSAVEAGPRMRKVTVRVTDSLTGQVFEFDVAKLPTDFVDAAPELKVDLHHKLDVCLQKLGLG